MTLFVYDRYVALNHVKTMLYANKKVFSNTTFYFGYNVSHIYQCLLMGGYYKLGSMYYDYETQLSLPVISKFSNLVYSLLVEVGANAVLVQKDDPDLNSKLYDLKTGDVVVAIKNATGIVCMLVDNTLEGLRYYSMHPNLNGVPLIDADAYLIFNIPDVGRF